MKFKLILHMHALSALCASLICQPASARSSGFNEQFIVSTFSQTKLSQVFPKPASGTDHYAALRLPDAPKFTWAAVNFYLLQLRSAGVTQHREIINLAYLSQQSPTTNGFDAEIASVLYLYKTHGIRVILAFGVQNTSADGPNNVPAINTEPQWIKSNASSTNPYIRNDLYSSVIADFMNRMKTNFSAPGWQEFLNNGIVIEPINEINNFVPGVASNPQYAAHLDNAVKSKLLNYGITSEVISSSIDTTFSEWGTIGYLWNYYGNGGVARPNIHLYPHPAELGNYWATLIRWDATLDHMFLHVSRYVGGQWQHWSPADIVVGEIGASERNKDGTFNPLHGMLMSYSLNAGFKTAQVGTLLYWRLFGAYIGVSCYDYPTVCGPDQLHATTLGFYRLQTPGNNFNAAGTSELKETQLINNFPGI